MQGIRAALRRPGVWLATPRKEGRFSRADRAAGV